MDAIINPKKSKNFPSLAPCSFLISILKDCEIFENKIKNLNKRGFNLRKLYYNNKCSFAGPFVGAPYAAILLEEMIAAGARNIILFGWCGAISDTLSIGDVIIPSAALIGEGTSSYYNEKKIKHTFSYPSSDESFNARKILKDAKINFKEAKIWSTDAIYREDRKTINNLASNFKIEAVDMETSALFTISNFRKITFESILIVSDELYDISWKCGFKDSNFIKTKDNILRLFSNYF